MKPEAGTQDMPLLGGGSEIASGRLKRKEEGSLTPPRERGKQGIQGSQGATLALSAAFDCCCSIAATVPIFPLAVRLPID